MSDVMAILIHVNTLYKIHKVNKTSYGQIFQNVSPLLDDI